MTFVSVGIRNENTQQPVQIKPEITRIHKLSSVPTTPGRVYGASQCIIIKMETPAGICSRERERDGFNFSAQMFRDRFFTCTLL